MLTPALPSYPMTVEFDMGSSNGSPIPIRIVSSITIGFISLFITAVFSRDFLYRLAAI